MAVRNDLSVNFDVSPRIITVDAPSTEITMQDAVDTLRSIEASAAAMDNKPLVSAAGKENLGGGTEVGLTVTLLNALIAFKSRIIPQEAGTTTSAGTTSLVDTSAAFVTNGVLPGGMVTNFTDFSLSTVIEVVSENELLVEPLEGGTNDDFTIGDVYRVYNEVQCNITGGNMVAVDAAGSSIDPVFPTTGTQVVRSSASSATSTSQASLEYATFNGGIYWDSVGGKNSITNTVTDGNEAAPLKNLSDVLSQAVLKSFIKIYVIGSATIEAADSVAGYILIGEGPPLSSFTFEAGASTTKTIMRSCHLLGEVSGAVDVSDCHVEGLFGVGGTTIGTNFNRCILEADSGVAMKLASTATEHIHMVGCNAGSKSNTPTVIDCNGAEAFITNDYWSGKLMLRNITHVNQEITISSTGGEVMIDATCTAGAVILYGDLEVTDNSGGVVNIIDRRTSTLVWAGENALSVETYIGLN